MALVRSRRLFDDATGDAAATAAQWLRLVAVIVGPIAAWASVEGAVRTGRFDFGRAWAGAADFGWATGVTVLGGVALTGRGALCSGVSASVLGLGGNQN